MNQQSYSDSSHDETPVLYLPILEHTLEDPNFSVVFTSRRQYDRQVDIKQQPQPQSPIRQLKQVEQSTFMQDTEAFSVGQQSLGINTNTTKQIYQQVKEEDVQEQQIDQGPEIQKKKKLQQTLYRKIDTNSEMQVIIKDKILKLTIIQNKSSDGSDINQLLIGTQKEIEELLDVFQVRVTKTNMGGYLKGIFYDVEGLFTHIKLTDSLQFNIITHKNPVLIIQSPTNTIVESPQQSQLTIDEYYLNFYVNQVLPGNRMVKRFCGLKLTKLNITKEIRDKLKVKKWRYMQRNIKCMGKKLKHVENNLDKYKDQNNQLKDRIKFLQKQLEEKQKNKGRFIMPLAVEKNKPAQVQHKNLQRKPEQQGNKVGQQVNNLTQKYVPFKHHSPTPDKVIPQRTPSQKKRDQNLVKLQLIQDAMTQRRIAKAAQDEYQILSQKNLKAQQQPELPPNNPIVTPTKKTVQQPKPLQIPKTPSPINRPKLDNPTPINYPKKKIIFCVADTYEKLAEEVAAILVPCIALTVRFQSTTFFMRQKQQQLDVRVKMDLNIRGPKPEDCQTQRSHSKKLSYISSVTHLSNSAAIKNLAEALKHNPHITQHITSLTIQHSHMLGCYSKYYDPLIETVNKNMQKLEKINVVYPHDRRYCTKFTHWTAYLRKEITVKLIGNFSFSK